MADKRTGSATQQLIEAAAAISGQPAAEITLEKAFEIIYQHDKEQIDQELYRAEYEALSPDQRQTIDETAEAMLQAAAIVLNKDRDKLTKDDINSAIEKAGKLDRIRIDTTPADPNSPDLVAQRAQRLKATTETVAAFLQRFIGDTIKVTITDQWESVIQGVKTFGELLKTVQPLLDELEELQPYLEAELSKPEYNGLTAKDFFEGVTVDEAAEGAADTEQNTLLIKALAAAREARDKRQLPTTSAKRASKIDFPVDKLNAEVWSMLQENTHGQLTFAIPVEKRGSKREINIIYSIDFDRLESSGAKITKRLTETDKRVYVAVAALFNDGNSVVSIRQIHYAMGNTKDPSQTQKQKIRDSLEKMARAWVTIDNRQEITANYKYGDCGYSGNLMHIEILDRYNIQGGIAESAIHIFAEPALMTFARMRKQITTVPVKLLQSPINKTENNLAIEGYLIERIARAKDGRGQNKIKYETVNEHAHIPTGQRKRTPEKVKRYLDYYKKCGHINRYTEAKDGVTVYF